MFLVPKLKGRTYTPIKHLEYVLRSKINISAHLHTIKNIVCVLKKCVKNRSAILKIRCTHVQKTEKKNKFRKMKKIQVEIK